MNPSFPTIDSLAAQARRRMPGFAWDYLAGGCVTEQCVEKNVQSFRRVELRPRYLADLGEADLSTTLFGKEYQAPFGIAPVGLQGLMWPGSCEILAEAAKAHSIPFILSTVTTASIETIGKLTDGDFWFQLYHPTRDELRDQILARASEAGCETLVVLADTPTNAYRPREIRNRLSMPPKITLRSMWQMMWHPTWAFGQLAVGSPEFATLRAYLPETVKMSDRVNFIRENFSGRLTPEKLSALRSQWKGNLVVKGIISHEDAETALQLGADGLIISNHGGRQLDSGQSSIEALQELAHEFGDRTTLLIDSGVRTGNDVGVALATGAQAAFLGRAPMYGVGALGRDGGTQVLTILKQQLQQLMEQIGCQSVQDLPNHRITTSKDHY